MKAANVIILQTIKREFKSAIDTTVSWIKCFNQWQNIDLTAFLRFRKSFWSIEKASEILVLSANLGNGFLINLILRFHYSLTSQHYFLQYYKFFELNKAGCFLYKGLGDNRLQCLGVCRFMVNVHPNTLFASLY